MARSEHRLRGRLEVDTEFGSYLGDTRIRLLEAISRHGSILQAAKAVPLSYKAAWDAVDTMNNLAEQPLVTRATGGRHGGGTQLTDYGRQTVALYRALEAQYQSALEHLAAKLGDAGAVDHNAFRALLRRLSMRTSARNQFAGHVVALHEGEVDLEVRVSVDSDGGCDIVAVITRESAETMGLTVGVEVGALVKSSSVLLYTDRRLRTSARNQLWGVVARIDEGPINSEVTLQLPGGRSVCAVVTHDSVAALGLAVGGEACAVFKASAVILCLYP